MKNILFEKIIDINKFDELPSSWQIPNIKKYSFKRTLFEYQEEAIKHAILGLYKYYEDIEDYLIDEEFQVNDKRKSAIFEIYKSMYDGNIELAAGQKRKDSKYGLRDEVFEIYEKHFNVEEDTISFKEFTNRMNFWMSTASGKSLVIIKLIQMLGILMDRGEIPKNNIMLLAPRNDLLNQLKDELEDFNLTPDNPHIRLVNLKEFEGKKTNTEQMSMSFSNEITVYYYRSDNFIDGHDTDAMLNYAQRVNNGKWYVILDEAHRGESGDSKMKAYFSAFSKNGFLFNFSATFTDEIDKITTIYNFNLKKFLEAGYGKKIYVSKSEFDDFKGKIEDDEVIRNKKKIVLKGLITLSYLKKCYEELSDIDKIYHSPMMLTLVNTVNKSKYETDPDLLLYFKEIMEIAQNGCDADLFREARIELINEFNKGQYMYKMGDIDIDTNKVSGIDIDEIYKYVYNSREKGEIEISYSKDNENEVAFFLKTSENPSPFCIVRIGEARKWVKDNLKNLTITERYEDKRYFENIDEYEDINILMGSRAFYEGWDSLRPNIINYINIGTQAQSQKYVLQSLGRGIRIQPIKGERKRIDKIRGEEVLKKLNPIKQDSTLLTYGHSLESLFVFATDKNVLEKVIDAMEKDTEEDIEMVGIDNIRKSEAPYTLLVPKYKETEFINICDMPKFYILKSDYERMRRYILENNDNNLLLKHDISLKQLKKIKELLVDKNNFEFTNLNTYSNLDILIYKLKNHIRMKDKILKIREIDENEDIVHFKKIKVSKDKYADIVREIEKVKKANENKIDEDEIIDKLLAGFISKEEASRYLKQSSKSINEVKINGIRIKYIPEHYYLPIITSENSKVDYITHIIKENSEYEFINDLESYIRFNKVDIDDKYEWWMFSKIDETIDKIYIPYYDEKKNKYRQFKPDFIFWLKEKETGVYKILFVDPKSTSFSDVNYKIRGYKRFFEGKKEYKYKEEIVQTQLILYNKKGSGSISEEYKKYWKNRIEDIF